MWSQRPQTLQAVISALAYPPELDVKNLLLQMSPIGVLEHGKNQVLTLKPHLYQLVFIVLEGTLCMIPEEKSNYQYYPAVTLQVTMITGLAIQAIVA